MIAQTRLQCLSCNGTYYDRQPDGSLYFHACAPLPPDANGVSTARPNARNENLQQIRPGLPFDVISEGAGAIAVATGKPASPPWLTALRAANAQKEGS